MVTRADRIEVLLELQDLATRELKQFERRVDRSSKNVTQDFGKVDRAVGKVNAGLLRLGIGAGTAFAAFAAGRRAVGAGFGFVDAASDFEEAFSKFSVVFGEEAPRVERQIDDITKAMGRSKAAFIDYSSGFQDLLVPMGFTREEAANLSVGLSELAVDVGSFSNRLDADVVADFNSALVGNSETVRKYGANLLEVNVVQKAYELGIADVGEKLTAQQKVVARVALLYDSTTDAQGDAIRTADSYSNSVKRLSAGIGQLRVEIGSELIDALKDAGEELGGTDAILKDIEIGMRLAALVTKGFIEASVALIRTLRILGDELGGSQNILRLTGTTLSLLISGFEGAVIAVAAYADVNRIAFQALEGIVISSANVVVGRLEDVVDAYNDVIDALTRSNTPDVDFGFNEALDSPAGVIESASVAAIKAFATFQVEADAAAARAFRRQSEFNDLASDSAGRERGDNSDLEGLVPPTAAIDGVRALYETFRTRSREAREEAGATSQAVGVSLADAFRTVGEAVADAAERVAEFSVNETRRLRSELAGAQAAFEDYAASLSDFELGFSAVQQGFGALENGIAGLSRDLIDGKADFSDFAESLVKDIGAIIVQFLLLRSIRGALGISATGGVTGGGLAGLLGFEKGGVGPGPLVGSLPVNAYASGGIATSPQIGIFGEGRQNEAFVPLPDGKRIPVEDRGGSGGPTNITFEIRAMDGADVKRVLSREMGFIQRGIATALEAGGDRQLTKAVRGA